MTHPHSSLWTNSSSSSPSSASHLLHSSSSTSCCYWIASCRWIASAWSCTGTSTCRLLCLLLCKYLSCNLYRLFFRELSLRSVGRFLPNHCGQFQKLRSRFLVLRCKVFLAYSLLNLSGLFVCLAWDSSLRLLPHNVQIRVIVDGVWDISKWLFWFLGRSFWFFNSLLVLLLRFCWLLLVFLRFKFFTVNIWTCLRFLLLLSFFSLGLDFGINLRIRIGVWIKERANNVIHLLNIILIKLTCRGIWGLTIFF